MGKPGARRREHRRHPATLPVRVSTVDAETDLATRRPFFRASREWCANLSRGGLFIRTDQPFGAGRRVLVELTLPDGRRVEAVGRVAWTRRSPTRGERSDADGVGVEFLAVGTEDLAALERFFRSESHARAIPHGIVA